VMSGFGTAGGVVQLAETGAAHVLGRRDQRQPGKLRRVPTFAEQGIDASVLTLRAVS